MTKFIKSFSRLPEKFYESAKLADSLKPKLIIFNHNLGEHLNLSQTEFNFGPNSDYSFVSMAYAGHQFGHFVPILGDGRAVLMAEVLSPHDNQLYDLHLKGSGQTSFSRRGDGKSALGPVLREYLVSEAINNLGLKTTRSLAAFVSGEMVQRETLVSGGLLCRVARSHVRVGTFEYFAAKRDFESIKILADYCIDRLYPELKTNNPATKYFDFWKSVSIAQLHLINSWMSVGFIHGVMNTDNMAISGETLDYGPCAFMDHYNPNQVFSFIDKNGRYAFNNQPMIALWNLARLAECLIPLIDSESKVAVEKIENELSQMVDINHRLYNEIMLKKLGLKFKEGDQKLLEMWLKYLEEEKLDYTLSFRALSDYLKNNLRPDHLPGTARFHEFDALWKNRLQEAAGDEQIKIMNSHNPVIIPRNHIIEKVIEEALRGSFELFYDFNKALENPYVITSRNEKFLNPPGTHEKIQNTFCGT